MTLAYSRFLGYEKGQDGILRIVEKEAGVVRRIYKLFLEGQTSSSIAKILTAEKIPTPAGKEKWPTPTVKSILQNEKCKEFALLQKTYTVDFLTKKTRRNNGEIPQYYIEHRHPAIVSPEVFNLVQQEFERRSKTGGAYGSKVWHFTSKYKRTIWQCNAKFKNEQLCSTPI